MPSSPKPKKNQPPSTERSSIGNHPLLGANAMAAKRLVVMGYTAREVAKTLGIRIEAGRQYVAKYQQVKRERMEEDLAVARGMAVAAYEKAQATMDMALEATTTIMVGEKPIEIRRPDFDAAAKFLAQMNATVEWLGQAARATGQTGAQAIAAESRERVQEREQEFAISHPDRIPGLGFAHPLGHNGLPLTAGPVMVFPKTPAIVEAERLRLQAGEAGGAEVHEAELMDEVLVDEDPLDG